MPSLIQVTAKNDSRANVLLKTLQRRGFAVTGVQRVDEYSLDAEIGSEQLKAAASSLMNPVVHRLALDTSSALQSFDWAIRIGFLPGVTDNEGSTARETLEDRLGIKLEGQGVFSSYTVFLSGALSEEEVHRLSSDLYNPIIQKPAIRKAQDWGNGLGPYLPKVILGPAPKASLVDLLNADDLELQRIGKMGIFDHNQELSSEEYSTARIALAKDTLQQGEFFEQEGKYYQKVRRGPLALNLQYMKAIQAYFQGKGRNPLDIEVETVAQKWSEHCCHTIFADPIDNIEEGLFKKYIKGATDEIRRRKGSKDKCVSVFTDNSGGVLLDENWVLTFKVETHNSPSALDPFGGAITGIVGVYRDAIGFGLGAKPISSMYGFCFGLPEDTRPLYKGINLTQPILSRRRILEGVIDGVNAGGNCSGVPTTYGFMTFDPRYSGKPLVFVGVTGLIPREIQGKPSHEKKANAGDYIVMIGGRVGKDGIHGATFSSEAMDSGSPATAVQIGDPFTQKKEQDALLEARNRRLYSSITDDGAGGLSCSVTEMARESGGCYVILEKIPIKYLGLAGYEKWISESQERMTAAVQKENREEFLALMESRDVEATIIGEFTGSGRVIVEENGQRVIDLDIDFLENGRPKKHLHTTYTRPQYEEPSFENLENLTGTLHQMLGRHNLISNEFISQQYDHEVQGGSVLKPLQGRGRVNADATVLRPVLSSKKGLVETLGVNPWYGDIDTGAMAACAVDTAVRNAVAAGANWDEIYLLDNFCWCSSDEPERLGQLKAAVIAASETAIAYETPFVSGKDSMFNDFKGYDGQGNPIKISVPPTLLVTAKGIMDDASKAVSLDAKIAGDLVYILGETKEELGASEFYAMKGEQLQSERFIGNSVPKVDTARNKKLYQAVALSIQEGILASAQSVQKGGLAIALAKTAMGGRLGLEVSLENLLGEVSREDYVLFSESQGRIVVTIAQENKEAFERCMQGNAYKEIGRVTQESNFVVKGLQGQEIVNTSVEDLLQSYRAKFEGY